MHFSLRWLLAATAYVALAAATLSQGVWYFTDILWAASLLAVAFALLVACYARGIRQAKALGFVIVSACFLLCLQFGGNSVPTTRLLRAAGVWPESPVLYPAPTTIYVTPGSQPPIAVPPAPYYAPTPSGYTPPPMTLHYSRFR